MLVGTGEDIVAMPNAIIQSAFVAAAFLLAGLAKGVSGLGLPTVGMGLLGLAMSPAHAAALMVVPALLTNIWQMLSGPGLWRLIRRLWLMESGVCLGTWAGAGMMSGLKSGLPSAALGIALIAYAAIGLMNVHVPRVPASTEWWLGGPWAAFSSNINDQLVIDYKTSYGISYFLRGKVKMMMRLTRTKTRRTKTLPSGPTVHR